MTPERALEHLSAAVGVAEEVAKRADSVAKYDLQRIARDSSLAFDVLSEFVRFQQSQQEQEQTA